MAIVQAYNVATFENGLRVNRLSLIPEAVSPINDHWLIDTCENVPCRKSLLRALASVSDLCPAKRYRRRGCTELLLAFRKLLINHRTNTSLCNVRAKSKCLLTYFSKTLLLWVTNVAEQLDILSRYVIIVKLLHSNRNFQTKIKN